MKKRKLEDQARISNTPLIGIPGRENGREEIIEELIQEYFQVQKGHVVLYRKGPPRIMDSKANTPQHFIMKCQYLQDNKHNYLKASRNKKNGHLERINNKNGIRIINSNNRN